MGAGRIGRSDGLDDRQLPAIPQRLYRSKRWMEAEVSIEIECRRLLSIRSRDSNARPQCVIVSIPVRDNYIQSVHSPPLKNRNEDFLALSGCIRGINRPGQPGGYRTY